MIPPLLLGVGTKERKLSSLRRYEVPLNDLQQEDNDTAKGKDDGQEDAPPIAATESEETEHDEVRGRLR